MTRLRLQLAVWTVLALALSDAPATGQVRAQEPPGAVDGNAHLFPEQPPLTADSPRHLMLYEDRRIVGQEDWPEAAPGDGGPTIVTVTLPAGPVGEGGTGTIFDETFHYQIPTDYVGPQDPRPLVVAYHGYGLGPSLVATQTTIDEECEARGWIYLAPTGIHKQVFGTPDAQQNVEAAIGYMQSNFGVDADRIYMIGFSMGGGIVASFASRHRDPDGLMVAGVATVAASFDWTLSYALTTPAGQNVFNNPLNFGGSPALFPFAYQRVSTLYATPGTYPPAPGTNDPVLSMGDNLHSTPLYMTWDTGDTLAEKPQLMGPQLAALLSAINGSVQTVAVSGTVDPDTQLPAPHSWAVLNEAEVFDFFDELVVNRSPAEIHGQLDRDQAVSWTDTTQQAALQFTWVDGEAGVDGVVLENVVNAQDVTLNAGLTGQSGVWPLHVQASVGDGADLPLRLTGFDQPPSYLLRTSDGTLLTGIESDPETDSLLVTVSGLDGLDVQVHSVPWLAKISTTPEPALVGGSVSMTFDAPDGPAEAVFLIVSLSEQLTPIAGGAWTITASMPAGILLPLPLDANDAVTLAGSVANDPVLSGLHLVFQGIAATPAAVVESISNLWGMDIQ